VAVASAAARDLLSGDLDGICPATPDDLAAKIVGTLSTPDPQALRTRARAAATEFDVERRALALADVYARAMAEHRPRGRRADRAATAR
jgi:hypothetical protein